MNELVEVDIWFNDPAALALAGVRPSSNPAEIRAMAGAVPIVGDVVRFAGLLYETGEAAFFVVETRTHEFHASGRHRIQLNVGLRVVHPL